MNCLILSLSFERHEAEEMLLWSLFISETLPSTVNVLEIPKLSNSILSPLWIILKIIILSFRKMQKYTNQVLKQIYKVSLNIDFMILQMSKYSLWYFFEGFHCGVFILLLELWGISNKRLIAYGNIKKHFMMW